MFDRVEVFAPALYIEAMRRKLVVSLCCVTAFCVQNALMAQTKVSCAKRSACSGRAICFSGEVFVGKEYRRAMNDQLDLLLVPDDIGWIIRVVTHSDQSCGDDFASVVTPPYRFHSALDINEDYGVSAEEEVSPSPRQFFFVTNCKDYATESSRVETVLWPYTHTDGENQKALAKLGSSPLGQGRMWITDSRISHASDTPENKLGTIEWIQFSVEIRLPVEKHKPVAKSR